MVRNFEYLSDKDLRDEINTEKHAVVLAHILRCKTVDSARKILRDRVERLLPAKKSLENDRIRKNGR